MFLSQTNVDDVVVVVVVAVAVAVSYTWQLFSFPIWHIHGVENTHHWGKHHCTAGLQFNKTGTDQ